GSGGQIPLFTSSCEVFDPVTASFTATASLVSWDNVFSPGPRSHHGASLLPDGRVLITGGFRPGAASNNYAAIATPNCAVWNAGNWSNVGALPDSIGFHTQEPSGNGAILFGGFTSDLTTLTALPLVGRHDGTTFTSLADLGTDQGAGSGQGRAAHHCTLTAAGTFIVYRARYQLTTAARAAVRGA